jgi:hypothetical protein
MPASSSKSSAAPKALMLIGMIEKIKSSFTGNSFLMFLKSILKALEK